MSEPANTSPEAVIGGGLQRDFILPFEGKAQLNVLGGNLPYAAAGYALWGGKAGLVARVNWEFPQSWIESFLTLGCDISGILRVNEPLDDRRFIVYIDPLIPRLDNPTGLFCREGHSLPA